MRIIFLNRFYWPDEPATAQLLTDLAEALPPRGHDVMVITSGRDRTAARMETRREVQIRRVSVSRGTGLGLLRKALDFAAYHWGAALLLRRIARPGDLVVALTDPPLIGVTAWLATRRHRVRLIHWVQDIYPELAIELAGQRWLTPLKAARNAAWRGAARCVTLGRDMGELLRHEGVSPSQLVVIPNWPPAGVDLDVDGGLARKRAWGADGKFVVGYSGNLGRVHDVQAIIDLAAALRDVPEIAFVIVGQGAQRDAMEQAARGRGLANMAFHRPAARASLAASLAGADVHLVTLRPGCQRLVYPSKVYGVAAVARPVVFIGPEESGLAREIRANDMGLVASRERVPALAAELRVLARNPARCAQLGANAAGFARAHSAAVALERWNQLFSSLGACTADASDRSRNAAKT